MTLYAKIDNNEIIEYSYQPTSNVTSNLWQHPDLLLGEGWYEVIDAPITELVFSEYFSGHGDAINEGEQIVYRNYLISNYSLEDMQQQIKDVAKLFVENKMQELFGGIAQQIAIRSGDLGVSAKDNYLIKQTTYINGYIDFVALVNAATNIAELEIVYDNHPQLRSA